MRPVGSIGCFSPCLPISPDKNTCKDEDRDYDEKHQKSCSNQKLFLENCDLPLRVNNGDLLRFKKPKDEGDKAKKKSGKKEDFNPFAHSP